ncbi:histidine phosphatase family protein [Deinococcus multiflagellatus]|uniref:Histidine phosphatase family protein n=1 Tax=Deinococcus multiflagellatus TaxID=1656887 RepID=A0ABW1ZFM0_9DEIO|nr:histidine phosphatase family protein [Deinococcus multiflagellatus]MBZ9711932.1 phosphoglycerate mutase family protein [Deinococcus multiflagellatus]
MHLWLIRHGETHGNQAGILRGAASAGDELSEKGHAQAQALAGRLAAATPRPQAVYASTYRRAQQTAEPLARALGVPVQVRPDLQEVDCGDWAGRPYADLKTAAHDLRLPGGGLGFRGGETFEQIAARFVHALEGLPQDQDAAVVSHGGILRIGLAALLGRDIEEVWMRGELVLGNTDYVFLEKANGEWNLQNNR